jgi:Tol biopolymer transport system component
VDSSDGESMLLYSGNEFLTMQAVGWSATDDILVAGKRADWTTAVGLVPVEGGDLRIVKTIASNNPTFRISPDGKWIAYDIASKEHAPRRDVYLLAADGSRESRVTSHQANDYVIGFTPESKALLFVSNRTGSYSLWAADILKNGSTAEPSLIQRDIGPILPLSITPDGAMFYARAIGAKDIFTAEIDWESGRIVAKPKKVQGLYQGSNRNATWSPDGRSFVYFASESLRYDHVGSIVRLVVHSWPDGEESEILPSGIELSPNYAVQFSPDGKRVM